MRSPYSPHPRSTVAVAGHALHTLLVAFAVVCLTLTLGTDVLYWQTSNLMWLEFSAWLLLVGIVSGVAALPFGVFAFFKDEERHDQTYAWVHAAGRIGVLILAFLNNLVHAADGWTAVVPYGLVLSALTVLLMLATVWLGGRLANLPGVGVRNYV